MPVAFDVSPAQAERTLREAGWTVDPRQTATGIFPGPPGESFREVEHTSVHATRDGWRLRVGFEWAMLVIVDRTSPPLPSEAVVVTMVGEMTTWLGRPSRSRPPGPIGRRRSRPPYATAPPSEPS